MRRLASLIESPVEEIQFKGQTYYKSTAKDRGGYLLYPGECFLLPDARTMVIGREKAIRNVIEQDRTTRPELVRGDGWQAVENCVAALAIDQPNDCWDVGWGGAFLTEMLLLDEFQIKNPLHVIQGVELRDTVTLHAIMDFPTAKAASENALRVIGNQAMLSLENTMLKLTTGA